jgi:hypothetical protein
MKWWCSVELDDARTISQRLRQIRNSRGKSLRVIAGLAGMTKETLSRIERGERSPTVNELSGSRWMRSRSATPVGWCFPWRC